MLQFMELAYEALSHKWVPKGMVLWLRKEELQVLVFPTLAQY